MFGWFKKKEPERPVLSKHTGRYIRENFSDYCEAYSFSDFMGYVQKAEDGEEFSYLHSAIDELFSGDQKAYLKQKLWDKSYGRG
jgi:hypothetical protein